jgi:XTP/dITP diphosphohydrolase
MIFYVATSNPGKLRDFAAAAELAGEEIILEPLPGLAEIPAPPEEEPTFEGNAIAKALYYSLQCAGRLVVADDSGLEVDSLNGAPGVRSARFAEDAGFVDREGLSVDHRNNRFLLQSMKGVPDAARLGRYRCVLAAAQDGKIIATAEGTVEGSILTEPRGQSGFGYDPLFYLPGLGKTMAELEPGTKLTFSHRGRALRALLLRLIKMQTRTV